MTRQQANQELVDILQYLVETEPDLRFSQILYNYGFVKPIRPARPELALDWQNEFYYEPTRILARVRGKIEQEL